VVKIGKIEFSFRGKTDEEFKETYDIWYAYALLDLKLKDMERQLRELSRSKKADEVDDKLRER